jgi:hypothetical protein
LKILERPLNFFISVVWHSVQHLRNSSRGKSISALSLKSLSTLRNAANLSFIHSALNDHFRSTEILPYFSLHIPSRTLRTNHLLHIPKFRLSQSQISIFYRFPEFSNATSAAHPSISLDPLAPTSTASEKRFPLNPACAIYLSSFSQLII